MIMILSKALHDSVSGNIIHTATYSITTIKQNYTFQTRFHHAILGRQKCLHNFRTFSLYLANLVQ